MNESPQKPLKRPRAGTRPAPDGPQRSAEFNEYMRSFFQQVKEIQTAYEALYVRGDTTTSPEAFDAVLWSLLSQLRPFLFICFPSTQMEEREASGAVETLTEVGRGSAGGTPLQTLHPANTQRRVRTNDPARDLRLVQVAHRIYSIAVRFTKYTPAAALHACLTLISIMPKLADPNPAAEEHTTRYLSTVDCLLTFICAWDREVFSSLVHALASRDGFGVFLQPTYPEVDIGAGGGGGSCSSSGVLTRRIHVLPTTDALDQLRAVLLTGTESTASSTGGSERTLGRLFRSTLSPRTPYERVAVAYGLWSILDAACQEPQSVLASANVDVAYLVAQACEALSLVFSPTSAGEGGEDSEPPAVRPRADGYTSPGSSARSSRAGPPAFSPTALTSALHTVVGQFLATLAEQGLLRAEAHAAQVLSMLVGYLLHHAASVVVGSAGVWTLQLLQWVASEAASRVVEGVPVLWLTTALLGSDGGGLYGQLTYLVSQFVITATTPAVVVPSKSPGAVSTPEDRPLGELSFYTDVARLLLMLVELAAAAGAADPALMESRRTLADCRGGGGRQWVSRLLTARLPARQWVARQTPHSLLRGGGNGGGGDSTWGGPSFLRGCGPAQLLGLAQGAVASFPQAVVWEQLDATHAEAHHTGSPSYVRLVEANILGVLSTMLRGAAAAEVWGVCRGDGPRTRLYARGQPQTLEAAVEATLDTLESETPSPASVVLLLNAFSSLFLFSVLAVPAEVSGAVITPSDAVVGGRDRDSEDLPHVARVAMTVLQRVGSYGVAHPEVYRGIPGEEWALFYATVSGHLPLCAGGLEDAEVRGIVRRASLCARRSADDRLACACRITGLARGLQTRMISALSSALETHAQELRRRARDAQGRGPAAHDRQSSRGGGDGASAGLLASASIVRLLVEESLVLVSGFHTIVQQTAEETPEVLATFIARSVVCLLFAQMARLQRGLFLSLQFLSLVGDEAGAADASAGDARNGARRAAVPTVATHRAIVVDVDDDDEDGEEGAGTVGGSASPTDATGDTGVSETDGRVSSLAGRAELLHGQLLSSLSTLLRNVPSRDTSGSDRTAFRAVYDRLLCSCLTLSPRSRDLDRVFFTEVFPSTDPVVACGYASLAFLRMLSQRRGGPLLEHARQFCSQEDDGQVSPYLFLAEESDDDLRGRLRAKLEAIAVAFRQTWSSYLRPTDGGDADEAMSLAVDTAVHTLVSVDGGVSYAGGRVVAEGRHVLRACQSLWASPSLPNTLHATVTDTALAVMARLGWSPEDVCRQDAEAAGTSFFLHLCAKFDVDVKAVLRRAADVVLPPFMFPELSERGDGAGETVAGGDGAAETSLAAARAQLQRLVDTMAAPQSGGVTAVFDSAMAYILYRSPTTSVKFQRVLELLRRSDVELSNLPRIATKMLPSILLHLISLEADAQLACCMNGESAELVLVNGNGHCGPTEVAEKAEARTGGGPAAAQKADGMLMRGPSKFAEEDEGLPGGVCFSIFSLAVRQLVTLSSGQTAEADLQQALCEPMSTADSSRTLVSSLFDVLDSIHIRMTPNPGGADEGGTLSLGHVSVVTMRRWLLGVNSFIAFLGEEATLLAAKLSAMLEACSAEPALLESVCQVWHTLVRNCGAHYLAEHAPAIVTDLVSLEVFHTDDVDERAFRLLLLSLRWLFTQTREQNFWQSYFAVMGTTSRLVRALREEVGGEALLLRPSGGVGATHDKTGGGTRGRRLSPSVRRQRHATESLAETPETAAATAERQQKVSAIMEGFLSIMRSSSAKCKSVFVRSLHHFLESADADLRLEMGRAAAVNLEVVPALLRCARDLHDPDDVQSALRCVGVIGAVAPIPVDTLPGNDTVARTEASRHLSETSARDSYHLTVPLVLEWRALAGELLSLHCPRALANTADSRMHDYAAYAVQELLRIYTKKERQENSGVPLRDTEVLHVEELRNYSWWANLDDNTQRMLSGFTTTRYTMRVRHQAERRTPEYRPGMPFDRWVFAFFHSLSQHCVGSFADVVKALRNVAKRDPQLLLLLLHVTLAQLLDRGGAEAAADVHAELRTVFGAASGASQPAAASADERQSPSQPGAGRVSLRLDSACEVQPSDCAGDAADRTARRAVDEHVRCLLHLLEDIQQLRWALLQIGRPSPAKLHERRGDEDYHALCSTALGLASAYETFLSSVPWADVARAAIDVGSHVRALRSIESQATLPKVADTIRDVPLQSVFAALNDRDSAKSIHNLSRGLEAADAAFSLENTGEWQLALQQCELVLQHHPRSLPHQLTYLRCMRQLGQLHMMSRYAERMLAEVQVWLTGSTGSSMHDPSVSGSGYSSSSAPHAWGARILQNYANEAAWRLGEWDRVSADPTLPVSLAVPVAALMAGLLAAPRTRAGRRAGPTAQETLAEVRGAAARERAKLTGIIRSTCREGYSQAYPYVATLHALADVELVAELYTKGVAAAPAAKEQVLGSIVHLLRSRLELVETTLEAREPLLALHRTIYRALGLPKEASDTWIRNARLLKDSNSLDAALSAARQSNVYATPESINADYYTLTTELLMGMEKPAQAIEFAQGYVDDPALPDNVRARLQIRLTSMRKDVGAQMPQEVVSAFKKAIALDPTSEEAHHSLALFYDQLYTMRMQQLEVERLAVGAVGQVTGQQLLMSSVEVIETWAFKAAEHFGLALLRGGETVSISLPRLLTLWLDCTEVLLAMQQKNFISPDRSSLVNFNRLAERLLRHHDASQRIPPRVVMTQLTLLLSRLGHPCADVVSVLTRTVVDLMTIFPQQTLWHVLAIEHSQVQVRQTIAKTNIIEPFRQSSRAAEETYDTAKTLFRALIDFCYSKADDFTKGGMGLTQMPFMKGILKKLAGKRTFLVPTVNNLTPNIFAVDNAEVFVNTPTLAGFHDKVRVLPSMQRPKRISLNTNEGQVVSYLAKAKDEPRKDIRTMEVAFLMNTIFLKNPDARRKHFSLLRYCVAALNDDCAIIEWVSNISTLRDISDECYRLADRGVSLEQIRRWENDRNAGKLTRKELLEGKILPQTPPVLHQWFDRVFLMSQEWYQARTLYTQSTALWSMVGHVIGLGDRHCENLSLCVHTGEMMHVDFAALFDFGETLTVPELVRFRLTQNIVDAMGILGVDGPFRANCEIALRCQQDNRKAVMSIVETLVHDPLLEWTNVNSRRSRVTPKQRMERVSRRLDGYLDLFNQPRDTLALSVEGQVAKLISHSSAVENLGEMYTWWMPWI